MLHSDGSQIWLDWRSGAMMLQMEPLSPDEGIARGGGTRSSHGPWTSVRRVEAGREARVRAAERRIAAISRVLDDLIEVPGTGRRFGLEPIIGLIPVAGDAAGLVGGAMILFEAIRLRLPPIVVARMGFNLFVDVAVGAVPILGDVFDFAFKANARNLVLFRRHALDPAASTDRYKMFFAGLVVLIIGILWLFLELAARLLSALVGAA